MSTNQPASDPSRLTQRRLSRLANVLLIRADPIRRYLLLRLLKVEMAAVDKLAQPALQLVFSMPAPLTRKRLGPEITHRIGTAQPHGYQVINIVPDGLSSYAIPFVYLAFERNRNLTGGALILALR